jgi:hypothetical protein
MRKKLGIESDPWRQGCSESQSPLFDIALSAALLETVRTCAQFYIITQRSDVEVTLGKLVGASWEPGLGVNAIIGCRTIVPQHIMKRVQTRTMTVFSEAKKKYKMTRNGFRMHLPKVNHTGSFFRIKF